MVHRRHYGYRSLCFLEEMIRKSGLSSFSHGAADFYTASAE